MSINDIETIQLGDVDLALICQRRGAADRIGFAVQLAPRRYPGYALAGDTQAPASNCAIGCPHHHYL